MRIDFTPDPALYPFTSRWFDSSRGRVHYVDEGSGPVILFFHGNPTWRTDSGRNRDHVERRRHGALPQGATHAGGPCRRGAMPKEILAARERFG